MFKVSIFCYTFECETLQEYVMRLYVLQYYYRNVIVGENVLFLRATFSKCLEVEFCFKKLILQS